MCDSRFGDAQGDVASAGAAPPTMANPQHAWLVAEGSGYCLPAQVPTFAKFFDAVVALQGAGCPGSLGYPQLLMTEM